MMYKKVAVVVEGGGMRGAYTGGILDVFNELGLRFGGACGTSAGVTHLCSFLSEQIGRNFRIDTVHSKSSKYMGWWNLIRTGEFFEVDYCYRQIPYEIDPFDMEKFAEACQATEFYACSSNLETGGAEYLRVMDYREEHDMNVIRASASLPLMSHIVEVDGMKLLDGGIADSIPFEIMEKKGFEKIVILLTQPEGFRKKPNSMIPLFKLLYRKYPKFIEAAANRHERYNACLDQIAEKEKAGKVFVFRPSEAMHISRLEKDKSKLVKLYNLGRKDVNARMDALLNFLEK